MTDESIQSEIKAAIQSAVDYMDSEIAPQQIRAQKYFDGKVDLEHEEGRSKVVSTKVRDVVRGAKPSLMRIFLSNDKFVEFKKDVQTWYHKTFYTYLDSEKGTAMQSLYDKLITSSLIYIRSNEEVIKVNKELKGLLTFVQSLLNIYMHVQAHIRIS